jgi:hypothetical protein
MSLPACAGSRDSGQFGFMEIRIEPKKLATTLLWIIAILTVIHSVVLFLYFYWDDDYVYGLVDLFDFDIEGNFPTFYSAVAMLLATGLLALITRANWNRENGHRFYWLLLTFIMLFLTFDEAAAIHETIGGYFEDYLDASGFLYFMWVVPYGVAVGVLGLFFLKFVFALPSQTRNGFIAAGVIFLSGAMGLEVFGAREADLNGVETITYCVLYTFEELLEMLGIVLFIYALACHLTSEFGRVSLVLQSGESRA